jgi:phage/plasmid-associated DNA primase
MLPRKKFKKLFEFLDISTIKENKTKITGLSNYNDEIFPEQTIEYFDGNLEATHDDVAKNFYFMYSGMYVCAQEKPTVIWYRCAKGKWERMDGVSGIRKEMASKFLNCYKFLAKVYVDAVDVRKDDRMDFLQKYTDTQIMERASTCYEIIQKLKTKGYTDSLIVQAISYFKIEKFIEKLDVNPHLLCFGENLYDLEKCEFRETRPEDMCSLQCGVSMNDIKNVTEEKMIEFFEMLISIFPLKERREYFMKRLSDFLYGKNTKEIFDIWTGTGGNGKGLLSTILKGAFGEYFYTGNVSGITAKKRVSSNSADPDVANFRGKRIIQFTEPSQGARLNNAIMKGYTGNDTMKARELYGAPIEFEPTFTPYIECNSFSLQDIQDDSIPRRLNFVKFRMKFVDADKVVNKSQAPRDETLKTEEKMTLFKVCMMKMLLETWENLTKEYGSVVHKFKVPETNLQDKEEFLAENDEVKQFIAERIEVTSDENDILTCKDIYEEYKELQKEERTGFKIKKGDFTRRLKNCLPVEYRERHRPRINGKQKNHRQCFLNVKWKEEELEYDL